MRVLVNNVETQPVLGVLFDPAAGAEFDLEYTTGLEPGASWRLLERGIPQDPPDVFIDPASRSEEQRFYRTTNRQRLGVARFNQWTFTAPAGSRHRIDYVDQGDLAAGWQPLTTITLSVSPLEFIDFETPQDRPRFYRTAPLP